MEVTKCSPQEAIIQLGRAFDNFFKGRASYPKFRKKGVNDNFSLTNDQFKITSKKDKPYIQIPNLGLVRMCEQLRFMVVKIIYKEVKKQVELVNLLVMLIFSIFQLSI